MAISALAKLVPPSVEICSGDPHLVKSLLKQVMILPELASFEKRVSSNQLVSISID